MNREDVELVQGPFFDELTHGQRFDSAPAVTLTSGHAAVHQAILGDRLALALDEGLAFAVTGRAPIAHPALAWDMGIGQSTLATHHVVANLFYRGLVLHRLPHLGDTLRTTTEVIGLRQNRARPGRAATGLAAFRVTTTDQAGRAVLDFWRCAMLPLADPEATTGHDDDLDAIGADASDDELAAPVAAWDLAAYRSAVPGTHFSPELAGRRFRLVTGDVVTSAPELARLTLNIAAVHHDAPGGRRLVYGGHTIGIAAAQLSRALPAIVTIAGWHGCDHTGPVHEGDTLRSEITVERTQPIPGGGGLLHLRVHTEARGAAADDEFRPVLDWRPVALLA